MNESINNDIIKKTPTKKRAKSYREKNLSTSMSTCEKDSFDAKEASLEVKSMMSTASTKKKKHHHHHHSHSIKKKKTNKSNKSSITRNKNKKVSFKETFAEVVHIENWKIYNTDLSEDSRNNVENCGKDKTKCTCILC